MVLVVGNFGSKLSVKFVSLSSGSRSSQVFHYEAGRIHVKAESLIPFQIQSPTYKFDPGD